MAKKGPPAESTLKARRRRGVIFQDEPIQWHKTTSKEDRCPWCGLQDVTYYQKRWRVCGNDVCGLEFKLEDMTSLEWRDEKLHGMAAEPFEEPSWIVVSPDTGLVLHRAQKMSRNGRALMVIAGSNSAVRWHRAGHVPEDQNGNRIVAPGSPFWYWLSSCRMDKVWIPEEEWTPLEVLAKAGTDDPVFMTRMPAKV